MDVDDLITRLEAATEGGRELDALIGNAVGRTPDGWVNYPHAYEKHYTTSVDAALTLMPEGRAFALLVYEAGAASAAIGEPPQFGEHEAPSPALALCIAAIKARQREKEQTDAS